MNIRVMVYVPGFIAGDVKAPDVDARTLWTEIRGDVGGISRNIHTNTQQQSYSIQRK